MRTDNLEVAQKLAKITGRPLEDFYDKPVSQARPEEHKQDNGESVEVHSCLSSRQCEAKIYDDTEQNGNRKILGKSECNLRQPSDTLKKLAKEWKADICIYGKTLISNKRQMTREEYIKTRRSLKTTEEFWNSPLLHIMFRSEEQLNPSFVAWTTSMELYIDRRNKEKK